MLEVSDTKGAKQVALSMLTSTIAPEREFEYSSLVLS